MAGVHGMTRILVTGASGAIGRPLVAALRAAGHDVHGVSRRGASGRWQHHVADLRDPESVAALMAAIRPEIVVHLAWCTAHPGFWTSAENAVWAAATTTLVRAGAENGLRRFVGAGSSAEYAWPGADVRRLAEHDPATPATPYGAAKRAAAEAAAAACAEAGIACCWARFFNLFGPDDPPTKLFGSLVQRLAAGDPPTVATPAAERDFLVTAEAGRLLAAVAVSPVEGPLNVATGVATPVGAFAAMVAAAWRGTAQPAQPAADPAAADSVVACTARFRSLFPHLLPRPLPKMIDDAVRDVRRDQRAA
jgi:nucleoside-diphosphate-sugar epimerase